MIVSILGLLDIIAGATVIFNVETLIGYLAYITFFKGLLSMVSSLVGGNYFDWMGAIDLITGLTLGLLYFNIQLGFFSVVGWLIILKGSYSLFRDVFNI